MDPATTATAATTPGTPPATLAAPAAPATPPSGGADGAPPPPAARVFTQEEVNRIAATARDEGRRATTKGSGPAPAAEEAWQAAIRTEREFGDAMSELPGVTKGQRAVLRDLVEAKRPDNVSDYIASVAAALGIGASPGTHPITTTPPPATTAVAPPGVPATPPAPPAPAPVPLADLERQ